VNRRPGNGRHHWRWTHVLAAVIVILSAVTYLNIVSHARAGTQTRTAAHLGDLDVLLHEESALQWKTLADRSAPVRVAREVGTIRARERNIMAALDDLPAGQRNALQVVVGRYHVVLDQELALLVVGRTDEAKELEFRTTEPQFAELSRSISALARTATSNAAQASRTADASLLAAMLLTVILVGALLRRFERAHQTAAQASAELLRQERHALQQARENAATIRRQAEHDALTGLPNRVLFAERVADASRAGGEHAVLFVDLDDFKRVNDSLGHAAGDELLTGVASRLLGSIHDSDTAARLGGDEFAVLVRGGASTAIALAERIITTLRSPLAAGGTQLVTQASIGIAVALPDREAAELLRNADVAMYAAKSRGKGRYAVFDPSMHDRARNRVGLEADLRQALDADELFLVYQPVVRLTDSVTVGAEALVRWNHPIDGLLLPGLFLPVAEESGLILWLGRWVLAEACRQAQQWITDGVVGGTETPFTISVNMSAHQLHHPGIVDDVTAALTSSGLDPAALIVEITESAIVHHHDAVARRLHALRSRGVRVALDDFGTGFSSLSHLQRFPVDQIKVDRSFVASGDQIVSAIIGLGKMLGLEAVAEGIEVVEQFQRVRALGCHLAQGYWFATPLPADAFAARLGHSVADQPTRDLENPRMAG
jgi:diguanylate cyclase (GGDEF)-like protein